jgi:hypothetical protein
LPTSIKEAEKLNWTQPKFFGFEYYWAYFHQDSNIYWDEIKFVSPDWHREVIFTSDSRIVNADEYMWTYNWFNPITEKNLHKVYDVYPYNEWWNTINDKKFN